jgi:ketopantoate reductase
VAQYRPLSDNSFAHMTTPSLIDWQLGRAIEVESIWGEALRRGRHYGLELTELSRLYGQINQANDHHNRIGKTPNP